jgi:predicted nucleotide-binding protein
LCSRTLRTQALHEILRAARPACSSSHTTSCHHATLNSILIKQSNAIDSSTVKAAGLAAAGFLQKIGLEAITLQDQPNQGLTIIEKFETYAREVGFAVVLLTPDDVGGAVSASSPMSRARQNVIFELGYFVGKLGRGKVCLLRKGQIEGFSDFDGVLYTPMDSGDGWKLKLAKEVRAAGFEFDDAKVWA